MIRANQRMLVLLMTAMTRGTTLAPALADLLRGELVSENGCWFLRDLREGARTTSLTSFPDRTGFECFVNHIHIGDFVDAPNADESLAQALAWAKAIQAKLESLGRFNVIVSCHESDCSVRFHRLRTGEAWLTDDLDGYTEEVLVIPVGI